MVRPGLSFFALTFGLFKAGAVPVLVDPGLGIKNLGPCLAEAGPRRSSASPRPRLARRLLGWGKADDPAVDHRRPVLARRLARPRRPPTASPSRPGPRTGPIEPDETAAILFTSGSTGVPKGAVYTHAIFQAQVDLLRDLYEIRARRGRPLHLPPLRPVRPDPGDDLRRPRDGLRPGRAGSTPPGSSRRSRTSASRTCSAPPP